MEGQYGSRARYGTVRIRQGQLAGLVVGFTCAPSRRSSVRLVALLDLCCGAPSHIPYGVITVGHSASNVSSADFFPAEHEFVCVFEKIDSNPYNATTILHAKKSRVFRIFS